MGARRKENDREVGRNIDFLGYQFDNRKTLLRKKTKKNFARKMKVKSDRRRMEIMSNYWGQCLHGNCRNLWNKLTNNYMGFAKKGISLKLKTKDGKAFFEGDKITLRELEGETFTVLDFATGLKIHNPDVTGKQRESCVVHILHNNVKRKFFSTSHFIIGTLLETEKVETEAKKNGQSILPIENVGIAKVDMQNGRYTYKFKEND